MHSMVSMSSFSFDILKTSFCGVGHLHKVLVPSVTKFYWFFLVNVQEDCPFTIHIATFGSLCKVLFVLLAIAGEMCFLGLYLFFLVC